jgi:hypothetical protein
MSEHEVKAFLDYRDRVKVKNDVKVHGRVHIRDRVRVKGRVQAHGHMKTSVSGNVVLISGQVVSISGQFVNTIANSFVPTLIRNGYSSIGSIAGGTQLSSGVIIFTTVASIPGNDPMWVGSIGVNSGTGYLLVAGNNMDINIDNLNKVWLFAQTSGQNVCWLAED